MRALIVVVPLLVFSSFCAGQSGYKIDFKIKGWQDTTAFLGHYYGEQTYLKDTASVNGQGIFSFDGAKTLPQGVYFVVLAQRSWT